MFEFRYRLAIRKHVKAKCQRHPRFDPTKRGRGAVIGGCPTCNELCDLQDARKRLDRDAQEFERLVAPWVVGKGK
jgi:hypothetical protein